MATIWFLEDDPVQRNAVTSLLVKMGHKTRSYSISQNLIRETKKLVKPDVVILDLALDGPLNGFQVAKRILKEKKIPRNRFLFISGWKPQFEKMTPDEFKSNVIIDKANWTLDDIKNYIGKTLNEKI